MNICRAAEEVFDHANHFDHLHAVSAVVLVLARARCLCVRRCRLCPRRRSLLLLGWALLPLLLLPCMPTCCEAHLWNCALEVRT